MNLSFFLEKNLFDAGDLRDVHRKANNYLLSIGRLAVHQFIMEKYITLFTFTGLSFKGKSLLSCGSDHRRA